MTIIKFQSDLDFCHRWATWISTLMEVQLSMAALWVKMQDLEVILSTDLIFVMAHYIIIIIIQEDVVMEDLSSTFTTVSGTHLCLQPYPVHPWANAIIRKPLEIR